MCAPSWRSIPLFHQEGGTEFEKYTGSLITVSHIDPKENGSEGVEPEPKAGAGFEIAEVDVRTARRHLAGVAEDCQIQTGKRLPAIFRVEEQEILVAESVFAEAAQRFSPSEGFLHVKWDRLTGACIS